MEKSCATCKHGKSPYPNARCTDCIDLDHPGCSIEWHRLWEPSEKVVKNYLDKINNGVNGMIESDYNVGQEYNSVSKPKHYMLFDDCYIQEAAKEGKGIEVRDVLSMLVMKMDECAAKVPNWLPLFESDYVQLMQYLMRFMDKNGKEDLEKARVYLNWMIEAYE